MAVWIIEIRDSRGLREAVEARGFTNLEQVTESGLLREQPLLGYYLSDDTEPDEVSIDQAYRFTSWSAAFIDSVRVAQNFNQVLTAVLEYEPTN
jgi:hypothetical protein